MVYFLLLKGSLSILVIGFVDIYNKTIKILQMVAKYQMMCTELFLGLNFLLIIDDIPICLPIPTLKYLAYFHETLEYGVDLHG